MIRRTIQAVTWGVVFVIASAFIAAQALAKQAHQCGRKQLRLLIVNAKDADDYQKLATYFHHQELLFHVKAQRAVDEYARDVGKYTMATKFVTRAAATGQLYDHYLFKAHENARLAKYCDEMLSELGRRPAHDSAMVVSVKDLQTASVGIPEFRLMGKRRP